MQYAQLLNELNAIADENYKAFHSKLLKNENINVIGVKVPALRNLAKKYKNRLNELLNFPDEFYEVTFLKIICVSNLNWTEFIARVDDCIPLIDNWATCDCFKPKAIKNNKREFLPYIQKYLAEDKQFYQRFALVTLLQFYIEDEYLPFIQSCLTKCNTSKYYVLMAAAWLIAEILSYNYDFGVELLKNSQISFATKNKAIQKASESLKLSPEQKNYLKTLKV